MEIEKGKSAEYVNEFKIVKSLGSGYSAEYLPPQLESTS